jgi:hypothetical protein
MESSKDWYEEEDSDGETEWRYAWRYLCEVCKATQLQISVEMARVMIMDDAGYAAKRKKRTADFEEMKADAVGHFTAAGLPVPGGRKLYQLAHAAFAKIFDELGDLILLKVRQLRILQQEMKEHQALVAELRETTDVVKIAELVGKIEQLNAQDMQLLGFANEAKQKDLWAVSNFQDELSCGGKDTFRYYFVCQAGGQYRCLHAMTSKGWNCKHDPSLGWQPRQKYYCRVCNATYKTKFGVIIEIMINGSPHYMRSEVPDDTTLDIQAMSAERKFFRPGMESSELFRSLPSFQMATSTFVSPTSDTDVFRLTDAAFFDTLPVWKWVNVLRFARGEDV